MCCKRNWEHSELLLELLPKKKILFEMYVIRIVPQAAKATRPGIHWKKTTLQMLLWEDKKQKPLESLIVISNEFFLDIVFVAALTILGRTGFRVRQEPAPCA